MQDKTHFEQTRAAIIDARECLASNLQQLGFEVLPSQANFLFVRHPERDALDIGAGLRSRGILVRHFAQPRIEQFLRITVGTPHDCDRLCNVLAELLGKQVAGAAQS
jgi:histidinol-phosphate aminotransferase